MTTAAVQHRTTEHRADLAAAAAPVEVPGTSAIDGVERYEADDARLTYRLALATAAGVLVVLVFFLAMMIVISGAAGPTA